MAVKYYDHQNNVHMEGKKQIVESWCERNFQKIATLHQEKANDDKKNNGTIWIRSTATLQYKEKQNKRTMTRYKIQTHN